MIHPLLRLVATEPHLLGDHVEAYADLLGDEVGKASSAWAVRIGLYAGAGVLAGLGLVLAGISLLLCAALPASSFTAPWALIVVPLAPLLLAVICVFAARARTIENAFDNVKKQLSADMAMLREVAAP